MQNLMAGESENIDELKRAIAEQEAEIARQMALQRQQHKDP
jgi:hypothetical protein